MQEEIRDALGVPGHVLQIKLESISVNDAAKELKAILSKYEAQGILNLKDIPAGEDKERFTVLWNELQKFSKKSA